MYRSLSIQSYQNEITTLTNNWILFSENLFHFQFEIEILNYF